MKVKSWLVIACSLSFGGLECGCARHEYHPEKNGYGYEMTYPVLPDSASYCRLVYDGGAGQGAGGRRTVWPEMMNGYYGNSAIDQDLIVFEALRPDWKHPEGIPIFLAHCRAPAVGHR